MFFKANHTKQNFVFGLDYWLDPEQLALKTIGFGGIQTQGTKQFGSRNVNFRYKTTGFGGIKTQGTKQKYLGDLNSRFKKYGLEEYQL